MNNKIRVPVKTKITPSAKSDKKPIKPKMGMGTGGFLTAKLITTVKRERKKEKEDKESK